MSHKSSSKGIKAFNTVYFIGIVFVFIKILENLKWTFQLSKNWVLPKEPFFSKVDITNSNVKLSITTYLIFAILYILLYGFIIKGLIYLNRTIKLLSQNNFFQEGISNSFKKAGKSFLIFAFGTYTIDIVLLFWAKTNNRIIDLVSTELIIFIILGYLLYFLSEVFKEGTTIKNENDLTI